VGAQGWRNRGGRAGRHEVEAHPADELLCNSAKVVRTGMDGTCRDSLSSHGHTTQHQRARVSDGQMPQPETRDAEGGAG